VLPYCPPGAAATGSSAAGPCPLEKIGAIIGRPRAPLPDRTGISAPNVRPQRWLKSRPVLFAGCRVRVGPRHHAAVKTGMGAKPDSSRVVSGARVRRVCIAAHLQRDASGLRRDARSLGGGTEWPRNRLRSLLAAVRPLREPASGAQHPGAVEGRARQRRAALARLRPQKARSPSTRRVPLREPGRLRGPR